jgi:hypothetical protein
MLPESDGNETDPLGCRLRRFRRRSGRNLKCPEVVCTENSILVDYVTESPNVGAG